MPHNEYRILVTGSRVWRWPRLLESALAETVKHAPGASIVIVHGKCDPCDPQGRKIFWGPAHRHEGELWGADWLAHKYALSQGWRSEAHPADWARYGKPAGMRRNAEMVKLGADRCLGFPVMPDSPGTIGCVNLAVQAGIPVCTYPMREGA